MKRTIRLIMLIMAVCLVSPTIGAAEKQQQREERKTPEQIAEMQARHIASRLKLDEETTAKFLGVYCAIQKAVSEVGDKNSRITPTMTDEEVENVILSRFDRSQKILDIRRRGYDEYRKFLTPRQIEEVYRLEKSTKKRLSERKFHKRKYSDSRKPKRNN